MIVSIDGRHVGLMVSLDERCLGRGAWRRLMARRLMPGALMVAMVGWRFAAVRPMERQRSLPQQQPAVPLLVNSL